MEKNRKNVSKNSHRNFIKRGGGSKVSYKLYKNTGILVQDGFPKAHVMVIVPQVFVQDKPRELGTWGLRHMWW